MSIIPIISVVLFSMISANAEFYEDRRCSCVCPSLDIGSNKSRGVRTFYQDNHITPELCNCDEMVLPRLEKKFNGSLSSLTYCLQCECHYETRNTTVVMIVIISLLLVIAVLIMYMTCLHLLQKIVKQRKRTISQPRQSNGEQCLHLLNTANLDSSDDEN